MGSLNFKQIKNKILLILQLAYERNVFLRAVIIGIIVGSILNLINQGDRIFSLDFSELNVSKLLFTYTVPYFVSTISSVLSMSTLKSGEISLINGEIQCTSCRKTNINISKGEIIPFCATCRRKTTWKLMQISDSKDKDIMERTYSMALFAEKNPSPIFRFDLNKTILETNDAANLFFSNNAIKNSKIEDYLPGLKNINLDKLIYNNEKTYFIENINNKHFHFELRGIADLGIAQIYGSDITDVIENQFKFPDINTIIKN